MGTLPRPATYDYYYYYSYYYWYYYYSYSCCWVRQRSPHPSIFLTCFATQV